MKCQRKITDAMNYVLQHTEACGFKSAAYYYKYDP